jgi:hypothetical protein
MLAAALSGIVDEVEGLGQRGLVVPAVVGEPADRQSVGERVGWDEVASTDLGGVQVELGGEQVDRTFDQVGGLGTSGASVGVDP